MPARLLTAARLALILALPMLASPTVAQEDDVSAFVVRLGRLESVSRQMSGQIEQLQYENRQLKEQLRKFQEDVEFRLQEGKGGSGGGSGGASRAPTPAPSGLNPSGTNPGAGRPQKRGDAFDPTQNPGAPGAPRVIGTTAPSAPLSTPPVAQAEAPPLRPLPQAVDEGEPGEDEPDQPPGLGGPVDLSPPRVPTTGAIGTPRIEAPKASVAATGSDDARSDFEAASALVRERQFERAEMSLRQFIQSHPRDRQVPRATYLLGESYLQRNRNREAAEQFLKVSTDYAGSPVAPEAMLKLGASLHALGAKAQACATLAEVERKFPGAEASLRQSVEREQKRARCAA